MQHSQVLGGNMNDTDLERVAKMFDDLMEKHKGKMWSATLDWEILEISSPRYQDKIQHIVPMLAIDFK